MFKFKSQPTCVLFLSLCTLLTPVSCLLNQPFAHEGDIFAELLLRPHETAKRARDFQVRNFPGDREEAVCFGALNSVSVALAELEKA